MSREQAALVLCVAGLLLAALVWLVLRAPAHRGYRPARLEDLLGVPPAGRAGGATLARAVSSQRLGGMPWFDPDGVLHVMVHPELVAIDDHLEHVAARVGRPR